MNHAVPVAVRSPDPLTRAGARGLLRCEPGFRLVETPGDAVDDGPRPVLVVVVGRIDDVAEVELGRAARGPDQRVVLVVDTLREPDLMKVLAYGVRTVLWRRDVTAATLAEAVRSAARGETMLPPDLVGDLVAEVGRTRRVGGRGAPTEVYAGMTEREVDVVALLADGFETREIAEKLAYSERTIKNVLYGLTSRLHLRNRAHAVAFALREGHL